MTKDLRRLIELATPAERERLRAARLDKAQRTMSLALRGVLYTGEVPEAEIARRRRRNKTARRSRRANRK